MQTRMAQPADAGAIAAIYNEGIEDRVATFETELRTAASILPWFEAGHLVIVAEQDGAVIAFAAAHPYSPRPCYSGVAEASVYVRRDRRGRGAGRAALEALIGAAAAAGLWKLIGRLFVENSASRNMLIRQGFREVGILKRHARLDGVWRDCAILELSVGV